MIRTIAKFLWITWIAVLVAGCKPDAVDSTGHAINISDYRGKWVVINYWATWCGPCISEIPTLNKLSQSYKNQVVVLGVNADNLDDAQLQRLAEEYGVTYAFLGKFPMEKWGISQIPTIPVTFVIDPKGNLVKTLQGPQTFENFQSLLHLPALTY